jgi:Sec-independent protein secretion pathway component TatC
VKRLCAVILVLQAVVHTDATTAGLTGGILAVLGVIIAGLLRYRWAYVAGSVLQILVIATGFMVTTMFFLGIIFAALWGTAIWLGWRVEGAPAR